MSDFDASEDPTGLPGSGREPRFDPAGISPWVLGRARHTACGYSAARRSRPERRLGVTLLARRRSDSRRACLKGGRISLLGPGARHRRGVWVVGVWWGGG